MASPPPVYAWFVLVILTMLSGIFSGLNLGLMSLTVEDLNIVINSSSNPKEVQYATRILPLRKKGNLLLCTLLIGNTVVNVMLAVVTDPIWVYLFGSDLLGTILALALPSALIVVMGEIVPQSVCSRYALYVGAITLPLTYVFVGLTLPFSWPISRLLDRVLGAEISGVFTRQGLLQLIKLNVESAAHAKESGLTKADGRLLGGALTFKEKAVSDVMTPLGDMFALPLDAMLDQPTFLTILERGHTRIPVYEREPSNIVALLLVKNLLGIGYERTLPLREVLQMFDALPWSQGGGRANRIVRVHQQTKLNVALDLCKKKRVHMLVVTSEPASGDMAEGTVKAGSLYEDSTSDRISERTFAGSGPAVGIATIEDFLEEILQEEIVDETDVYFSNAREASTPGPGPVQAATAQAEPAASAALPLKRLNSKHFDTTVVLRSISKKEKQGSEKEQVVVDVGTASSSVAEDGKI